MYHYGRLLFVFMIAFVITACTVNLVSQYDPTTDKMVTQLQRQVDSLLLNIKEHVGTHKGKYRYYQKQYDKILVDTQELLTRTEAIPHNQLTVRQVKLLQNSLQNLQKLHKIGFKSIKQVSLVQQAIDSIFLSILKLELAKKNSVK